MDNKDQRGQSYQSNLGDITAGPLEPALEKQTVSGRSRDKSDEDEISIKEIVLKLRSGFRYMLSKWPIIIVAGIIGGIGGLVYSWSKKPVYTATTTFVLESGEDAGGIGQYAGIASIVGIDVGGGGGGIFRGDNIIELYKSRSMIQKTLLSEVDLGGKKDLLINLYLDMNQVRQARPELSEVKFTPQTESISSRLQDSLLGAIVKDINQNYLTVDKPDKKLSIIQVDVKAKDELFAKAFNDQIVKNVNDFYIQTKTKKALENVLILEQKTDSVRAVMNGAIYSAAAVGDATPNLNPTRQVQRTAPMQRSQFSAETNKAILSELVKNLEISRMALLKETPLIQVIDSPVFPLDKEMFGKKKGVILGGLLAGILTIMILLFSKLFKGILG